MIFVALLRGINVGGNHRVEMSRAVSLFERLHFTQVKSYINSGNLIFSTQRTDHHALQQLIQTALEKEFGFTIPVVIRSLPEIQAVCAALHPSWVNSDQMKCDVLFLWDAVDHPQIVEQLKIVDGIDAVSYVKGAVIWKVDRLQVTRSGLLKIVGTPLYRQVTVRNCNTVRKLCALMGSVASRGTMQQL